jgi:hypothetical protein
VCAVPQTADIHPGTRSNMLQRGEGLDLTFVVIVLLERHVPLNGAGDPACGARQRRRRDR